MQKSRLRGPQGAGQPSWRGRALIAAVFAAALLAACAEDGIGKIADDSGRSGAGAGKGGASAGWGSGPGGEGTAGRDSTGGEAGSNMGEGGTVTAGRGHDAGASDGGMTDSGGSGGREGAAGATDDGVLGMKGGRVGDADGDITLDVPPGGLLGDTRFSFASFPSLASVPDGYVELPGTAHGVTWSGAGFAANASVTVRIRVRETLQLEVVGLDPDVLLGGPLPSLPVSGVSFCEAGSSVRVVQTVNGSWEVVPECESSGGSGGSSGGSVGGSGSLNLGLVKPDAGRFPAITAQPAALSVGAGWDVSFMVLATGDGPLTYQWLRDGDLITGATSRDYRHGPASLFDNGARFSVSVGNWLGTVKSEEALLHVAPPSAPVWDGPRAVLREFGTDFGAPDVGLLVFGGAFAAWNDNGMIEADGSNYGPVDALSVPAQSAPRVLTSVLMNGYVVFVTNDASSRCSGSTGNRLTAVGISTHENSISVPNSDPFALYVSEGGCIDQFAVGMADPNPALLPDPSAHDPIITIVPIVYALTEQGSDGLKVGVGGAGVATCGFCSSTAWEYAVSRALTLPAESACSGPARLGSDGIMGRFQTHVDPSTEARTSAVLAWVANDNLCAATLDDSLWADGRVVFDNVFGDVTPVAALDSTGNALVAASRVEDPEEEYPSYRMTTGYRDATAGGWEIHALGSARAPGPVSTAFSPSGGALIAWVNITDEPRPVATHRSRAGNWDEFVESISTFDAVAVGSGRPRLCIDTAGTALALFEQTKDAELPLQIWGKQWVDGFWSDASVAQDNAHAGSDANCQRQSPHAFSRANPFTFSPGFVTWREADPEYPSLVRLVAYGALP